PTMPVAPTTRFIGSSFRRDCATAGERWPACSAPGSPNASAWCSNCCRRRNGNVSVFRRIAFVCVLFVAALHVVLLTGLVAHIRQDTSIVDVVTRMVPVLFGSALAIVGNQ